MPARFYMDAHMDKAIAVQARRRGIDILRCQDVGMDNAGDDEHLAYAAAERRTVITADADFVKLHTEWLGGGRPHAGIIYVQPERKDDIGLIVDYLEFLHLAVEGGAADLEKDVYNTLRYL